MTRKQLIIEKAKGLALLVGTDERNAKLIYEALMNMALFMDENPKCPWIKLSEKKPRPKMRVIFLDNTGKAHFGSGNIAGDGAVVVGTDGENMPILTHWMPIPKLPRTNC